MYYKLVVYQSLKILLDTTQNVLHSMQANTKRILFIRMSLYVLRYGLALKIRIS